MFFNEGDVSGVRNCNSVAPKVGNAFIPIPTCDRDPWKVMLNVSDYGIAGAIYNDELDIGPTPLIFERTKTSRDERGTDTGSNDDG